MSRHQFHLTARVFIFGCMGLFVVGCSRRPDLTGIIANDQVSVTTTGTPQEISVQASPPVGQELAMLPQAKDDLFDLNPAAVYTIELYVDFDANAFQGQMQLDYTNRENTPQDNLYFRLLPNAHKSYGNGSLEVLSVTVDDQPVETQLSLSDSVLQLVLRKPLQIDQRIQIEMDFRGQVPLDFGGEESPEGYGIYNSSDRVLALSGWYPILSVYDDEGWNLDPVSVIGDSVYSEIAFFQVDVTADNDLLLAATGVEVNQQEQGSEIRRRYLSGPVRDFFLIMSPDFELTSEVVDGVRLNSYYLPGHESGGEQALQVASKSLQIFNRRFGEYPFLELDVVEAPMQNALGVEYPGVFLVASDLYDDPGQDSFLLATAHEVAHQWWYSLVGNDVLDEPWLDEALATYSSSLYYQEALGESAYRGYAAYWQDRLDILRKGGQDDRVTNSLEYFEALNAPSVYGTVVYTKGALFLKALREEIGDQAFFGALQQYFNQYKYAVADTAALLGAFESVSDRSLDDFYQQWLFSADR